MQHDAITNRRGQPSRWLYLVSGLVLGLAVCLAVVLVSRSTTGAWAGHERGLPEHMVGQPWLPTQLTFAGERVPLERADVREALDWELCVAANWHSHILIGLKRAGRYFPIIEPILKSEGVPSDFKYLAVAESTLYDLAVSPSRAVGVWQFLEGTARDFGLQVDDEVDERYHLEKATRAACRYLKKSYAEHGSWTLAAAAYNMGHNGVRYQSERQLSGDYYNLILGVETGRYVFRILALKQVMENPQLYGFTLDSKELFPKLNCETIQVDSTITDLARFALDHGANYKTLKWLNPWLRTNRLTVNPGQKYDIRLLRDSDREKVYAQ